ncbi:uncharacterized protein [Antedon mediterranea]|uniref:uncharacterized protein n=1 Tax=Antedon mediterranea TaxID=105859 RepID=UPI003AF83B1E
MLTAIRSASLSTLCVNCQRTNDCSVENKINMPLTSAKLRSLSHKVLTPAECQQLKTAIQSFRENHSIVSFCSSLKVILNTKEKMQILVVLHSMVPEHLLLDFNSLCSVHFQHYERLLQSEHQKMKPSDKGDKKPARHSSVLEPSKGITEGVRERNDRRRRTRSMEGNLDRIHLEASTSRVPGKKDKQGDERTGKAERKRSKTTHVELLRVTSTSDEIPVQRSSRSGQNLAVRKVKLENRHGENLGFCIRGGKDLNAGIYISSVDSGGQAEKKGLKVGERILKVNGTSLKNVTHAEAVVAIKSAFKLTLYLAQCGQMPGTPNDTPRSRESSSYRKDDSLVDRMRVVLLVADDDGFLGCSIRGGIDYGLPVTVASIDPLSPAHKAGLKRGELVLKVNGEDISGMNHLDVVDLMTTSNVVKMLVMPNMNRVKRSLSSQTSTELRRSPRLQQDSNQGRSSTLDARNSSRILPTTPIRVRRRPGNISAFEQELRATPPRSTSTPIPNGQYRNQNVPINESLFSNDRSLKSHDQCPIPKLNLEEPSNTSGGSSVENIAPELKGKEFENGTIRLNLNSKEKLSLKNTKIVDINVAHQKDKRRRESIKHVFYSREQLSHREENNGDVSMEFDVTRNRSPKPSNYDLQNQNFLGSPHIISNSNNSLQDSGKVSPLLLPLQNIGVSSGEKTPPTTTQSSKIKKKNRISLAAQIFSKKRARGSISSSTSAYSSSESLDTEGRTLPSFDVVSNMQDWFMY